MTLGVWERKGGMVGGVLTCSFDQRKFVFEPVRPKRCPVRDKVDSASLLANLGPIRGPAGSFKGRHHRFAVDAELGGRVLVEVDPLDYL